jgi:hypothetical protein
MAQASAEKTVWLSEQWWVTGQTTGFRFPARARDFSLFHSVQTGSVAHPASYPMGTVDF